MEVGMEIEEVDDEPIAREKPKKGETLWDESKLAELLKGKPDNPKIKLRCFGNRSAKQKHFLKRIFEPSNTSHRKVSR